MKHIAYTGGGTLGSVTPLLALAEQESAENKIWIGTQTGPEKAFVKKAGISFFSIPEYKLRRYASLKTFSELPNFFKAVQQSIQILKEKKIDFVYTAGGFTGVPVCFAARRLGIPYALLQLDVRAGLANRLVKGNARYIFTALEHHTALQTHKKIQWVGIPVSPLFYRVTQKVEEPTLLFLGGGTGSLWLNSFVVQACEQLSSFGRILHVFASHDRLPSPPKNVKTYEAYKSVTRSEMAELFSRATCVITRAGMGSIAECAAMKKPTILVPMPKSHQEENAQYFQSRAAAKICLQKAGHEHLLSTIKEVMGDGILRERLGTHLAAALPTKEAAQNIITTTHET